MPPTARLTDVLRGHRKAAALLGAAAALAAGAGTATAATVGTAQAAPVHHAATVAVVSREHVQHAAADARAAAPRRAAAERRTPDAGHAAEPRAGGGRRPAAPALRGDFAPARPYEIYDSVTPSSIPSGHEVATYADGPFAVSHASVAGKNVLWIDTNGSDPHASALDVEPGDVTPTGAGSWAAQKLHADPRGQAIIYTMKSEWSAAQAAVRAAVPASEQSHVRWWIADPTGVQHVVPGSSATQWYWGSSYDISTATPGF